MLVKGCPANTKRELRGPGSLLSAWAPTGTRRVSESFYTAFFLPVP
jgi:hypothetical protein